LLAESRARPRRPTTPRAGSRRRPTTRNQITFVPLSARARPFFLFEESGEAASSLNSAQTRSSPAGCTCRAPPPPPLFVARPTEEAGGEGRAAAQRAPASSSTRDRELRSSVTKDGRRVAEGRLKMVPPGRESVLADTLPDLSPPLPSPAKGRVAVPRAGTAQGREAQAHESDGVAIRLVAGRLTWRATASPRPARRGPRSLSPSSKCGRPYKGSQLTARRS
jgi:hypothetical protein